MITTGSRVSDAGTLCPGNTLPGKTCCQWSAVMCSVAAACVGLAAVAFRTACEDQWIAVSALSVGFSWFLFNVPVAIQRLVASPQLPTLSHPSSLTVASLAVALVGFLACGVSAGIGCAMIGVVALTINVRGVLNTLTVRHVPTIAICGGISAVALIAVVWGRGFLSPLFDQELQQGISHKDTIFHMAICNMLRTYGIPSTGLDGLPVVPYHWGSHFVLGIIADGFNASTMQAYNIVYPVVICPLLLHSLMLAGILSGKLSTIDKVTHLSGKLVGMWALIVVSMVGFLPSPVGNAMGLRPSSLISESMCLGIVLATLGLSVILPEIVSKTPPVSSQRKVAWLKAAMFPLFIGLLGITKVSFLVIAGPLVLLVMFRHSSLIRRPSAICSLAATLAVALAVLQLCHSSSPGKSTQIESFHYLKWHVGGINRLFFFPVSLAWFALACLVRFREERVRSWPTLLARIRSRRLIDLELLTVSAFVGFAISMTIVIPGGSGVYFHNVQQWIAVVIVLGTFMRHRPRTLSMSEVTKASGNLFSFWGETQLAVRAATLLTIIAATNISIDMVRLARRFDQVLISETVHPPQPVDSASLQISDVASGRHLMLNTLDYVSKLASRAEKRETALFIPKTLTAYWDCLGHSETAKATPFIAPALTGIAMVAGAPDPHPSIKWEYYFYELYDIYGKREPLRDGQELSDFVFNRAVAFGFKRILMLSSTTDGIRVLERTTPPVASLIPTGSTIVSRDDR